MGLLKFKQPIELFEPGLWTRAGVSKPAGASVGNCGAFCANRGACSPNKEIRTTVDVRIMSLAFLESLGAGSRARNEFLPPLQLRDSRSSMMKAGVFSYA